MPSPKVTVLLPVYNGERYLHEAIESVLDQSFADFELLIVNDGSTDHSVEIIQSYSDPRIRLLHNEKNLGLIATLNKGLDLTRGEYIARMDCDDVSLPSRLEKQVNFMDSKPDVGVCGTWLELIGEGSGQIWASPGDFETIRCTMIFECPIYHPTVIIRQSILKGHNLHYGNFPHAEDYELWVRLSGHVQIANLQEVLLLHRNHSEQIGKLQRTAQNKSSAAIRFRQIAELGISPSKDELLLHECMSAGRFKKDKTFIHQANEWLLRLSEANKSKNMFSDYHFSKLLAKKWFAVCYNAASNGIRTWEEYWSSSLCDHFKINKRLLLKFVAKCILHYDKHGG
jgi:glycosyltransferase involved in cell wall biosynthesis